MLTGPEIIRQVEAGRIVIDPFDPAKVGANSVDLTLGPMLLAYKLERFGVLDMDAENPTWAITVPDYDGGGTILSPGVLYLGHTAETVGSDSFVPCLEGRSSIARLGMQVHLTAGFGDLGFVGQFTLEIVVVHPLRIYAGVPVCQVSFTRPEGEIALYKGRYQGQSGPQPSRLWQTMQKQQPGAK